MHDEEIKGNSMEEITIERCPHDKENPYVMVNRNLIRDETISPNCRWLLVYLSSIQVEYPININDIENHVKKYMSFNEISSLFDEAIEAGHLTKQDIRGKK